MLGNNHNLFSVKQKFLNWPKIVKFYQHIEEADVDTEADIPTLLLLISWGVLKNPLWKI